MVIAKLRLERGRAAYYDPYSGLHFTINDPIKEVHDYMNLKGIKRNLKNKVIELIAGSLDTGCNEIKSTPVNIESPVKETIPVVKEKVETVEVNVEEEPKKKKTAKKKKDVADEVTEEVKVEE